MSSAVSRALVLFIGICIFGQFVAAKLQLFSVFLCSLEKNVYLCSRFGDAAGLQPRHKRESGVSPEQYPLLSSPCGKSTMEATEQYPCATDVHTDHRVRGEGPKLGKADFLGRARKPAICEGMAHWLHSASGVRRAAVVINNDYQTSDEKTAYCLCSLSVVCGRQRPDA